MRQGESSNKVDIVISIYNQEKVVSKAIESVVNQTYPNIRIILSDDYSTDGTREIINDWALKYPDKILKNFNSVNLGITGNAQQALSLVTGDYFVMMGGDDIMYPTKIEEQVNWFKNNPEMHLCGHAMDIINDNDEKIGKKAYPIKPYGEGAFAWIRYGMLFGCLTNMIKIKGNHVPSRDTRLKYSSDIKFFIDFLGQDKSYGYIDKPLGAYRKSVNSITVRKSDESNADYQTLYQILLKEKNNKYKNDILKGLNRINYGEAIRNIKKKNYSKARRELIKIINQEPTHWKAYIRLLQSYLYN